MGNRFMSKTLAVFVAVAVMMTSAIGVFAAGSPEQGAKPEPTAPTGQAELDTTYGHYGDQTMDVSYSAVSGADSYNIIVNGKVVQTVKGTSLQLTNMEKGGLYDIQIQALAGGKAGTPSALASRTLSKRWFKNITKVKAKKGKKKFTVTWKKVKGASGYMIKYTKDGKTWKTKYIKGGKKQKAVIKKLKKGSYKVAVCAVKGNYLGIRCKYKTVKVK